MNSNEDRGVSSDFYISLGKRRAYIIPSARPSIHDHKDCIFAASTGVNMARFGVDVVDNAMSILSEPIRPPMFERLRTSPSNLNGRRNSFNNDNRNNTDDDALLSISAPATLPSRLRYTQFCDESEDEEISVIECDNESFYSSTSSPVINRNCIARNVSLSNESIRDDAEEKSSQSIKLLLSLISLVVIVASVYMKYINIDEATAKVAYDEYDFYSDVIYLGNKYKINEKYILKFQNGIDTIYKKREVGSFIFAYNSNRENFDKNAFDKFMNEISFTASKYLRNESTPVHYILRVEGKDLNIMEDHSEVMRKFREKLHKNGVMLVKDIEAFPSRLAMAFYYICDEYNPWVKKSAIFFTIDLAKCFSKEENPSKFVPIGNCLATKWNSIPPNSIGPLLARVVNVIVDVTTVF